MCIDFWQRSTSAFHSYTCACIVKEKKSDFFLFNSLAFSGFIFQSGAHNNFFLFLSLNVFTKSRLNFIQKIHTIKDFPHPLINILWVDTIEFFFIFIYLFTLLYFDSYTFFFFYQLNYQHRAHFRSGVWCTLYCSIKKVACCGTPRTNQLRNNTFLRIINNLYNWLLCQVGRGKNKKKKHAKIMVCSKKSESFLFGVNTNNSEWAIIVQSVV